MLNFLVSTTRQWNCGDEFILFGIRNLVENIFEEVNWVIFDRNPDLKKLDKISSNNWHIDDLAKIDYIIVAGTPEWFGDMLHRLYESVLNNKRHVFFIGIGTPFENIQFTELDRKIINNSPLIISRDLNCQTELNKVDKPWCVVLPCPAFYAFEQTRLRRSVNKIGLVIQWDKASHNIDETSFNKILELAKVLNCDIICHHVDEYLEAIKHFSKVKYSYNSNDYFSIYSQYDLIISTRLHGAIFAMSNGIPAILVKREDAGWELENKRICGAGDLFPNLIICNASEVIKELNTINCEAVSNGLIKYKSETKSKYLDLLSKTLKKDVLAT